MALVEKDAAATVTGSRPLYDSLKSLASKRLAAWAAVFTAAQSVVYGTQDATIARAALGVICWVTVAYVLGQSAVDASRAFAASKVMVEQNPPDVIA